MTDNDLKELQVRARLSGYNFRSILPCWEYGDNRDCTRILSGRFFISSSRVCVEFCSYHASPQFATQWKEVYF